MGMDCVGLELLASCRDGCTEAIRIARDIVELPLQDGSNSSGPSQA
jgi:hypothetical protein